MNGAARTFMQRFLLAFEPRPGGLLDEVQRLKTSGFITRTANPTKLDYSPIKYLN